MSINQKYIPPTKTTFYFTDSSGRITSKSYTNNYVQINSVSHASLPEIGTCEGIFQTGRILADYGPNGEIKHGLYQLNTIDTAKSLRGAWIKVEAASNFEYEQFIGSSSEPTNLNSDPIDTSSLDSNLNIVFVGRIYDVTFRSGFGGDDIAFRATDILELLNNKQPDYYYYDNTDIKQQFGELPEFNYLVNDVQRYNAYSVKPTGSNNFGSYSGFYFNDYCVFFAMDSADNDTSKTLRKPWTGTRIVATALQQILVNYVDYFVKMGLKLNLVDMTTDLLNENSVLEKKVINLKADTWLNALNQLLDRKQGFIGYLSYTNTSINFNVFESDSKYISDINWTYEDYPHNWKSRPTIQFADQDLCRGVYACSQPATIITTQKLATAFSKGWDATDTTLGENSPVGRRFVLNQTGFSSVKSSGLGATTPNANDHATTYFSVGIDSDETIKSVGLMTKTDYPSKLYDQNIKLLKDLPLGGYLKKTGSHYLAVSTGGDPQLVIQPILIKKNAVDDLEVVNCQLEVMGNQIIIKQDDYDFTDDSTLADFYITFAIEVNPLWKTQDRENPLGSYTYKRVDVAGLNPILLHQNTVVDVDTETGKAMCAYDANNSNQFVCIGTQLDEIIKPLNKALDFFKRDKVKTNLELNSIPSTNFILKHLTGLDLICEPQTGSLEGYRQINGNLWVYNLKLDCYITKVLYDYINGTCTLQTDWINYV